MQRDRQNHHGGALKLTFRAFRLAALRVQMRNNVIQRQKEQDAEPKAQKCRKKRQPAQKCGLFNGGNEQAPYRSGNHNTGGKTGQRALNHIT